MIATADQRANPPRALPHSEEVERAVLSCVLLSPETIDAARGLLPSPEAFYLERHRLIWNAMIKLRRDGTAIDMRTLQAALETTGDFEKVGGMAYLAGLDLDLPLGGLERVDQYCQTILDRWAKRRLYAAASKLAEHSLNGAETEDLIAATAASLDAISRDRSGPSGAVVMSERFDAFDPDQRPPAGISTGLVDLDAMLGGYRPGQLVIVAGRPGFGKTSYACQLATATASAGLRVRLHSLEMTADEIARVMIAQRSGVPARSIVAGTLTPNERRWTASAASELADIGENLVVDPTPAMTPGQIWAAASLDKIRHGLDLLIIDSLGLVRYAGPQRDKRLQIDAITAECKEQAKRLEVPVILLHHPSRKHEHDGRRPTMRDLMESQGVERDADVVIFPYHPGQYLEEDDPGRDEWQGRALFLVEKHRGGEKGAVVVSWNGPRQLFGNVSTRGDAPRQKEVPF